MEPVFSQNCCIFFPDSCIKYRFCFAKYRKEKIQEYYSQQIQEKYRNCKNTGFLKILVFPSLIPVLNTGNTGKFRKEKIQEYCPLKYRKIQELYVGSPTLYETKCRKYRKCMCPSKLEKILYMKLLNFIPLKKFRNDTWCGYRHSMAWQGTARHMDSTARHAM